MSRRPMWVLAAVLLAYGCTSMPWQCQPGDARLQCREPVESTARDIRWNF